MMIETPVIVPTVVPSTNPTKINIPVPDILPKPQA